MFVGWQVNLIRDIPFAGVKIGLYEIMVQQYVHYLESADTTHGSSSINKPISPTGAAVCGIVSGVACAIITCPLDVINTRIKSSSSATSSMWKVGLEIGQKEGLVSLFRGVGMRSLILGVGSCLFWPIQRSVSDALQRDQESAWYLKMRERDR